MFLLLVKKTNQNSILENTEFHIKTEEILLYTPVLYIFRRELGELKSKLKSASELNVLLNAKYCD